MAWLRVDLLLVLTGTMLLVSVQGWGRISNSELLKFYETGVWSEPFSFTADEDDSYDFNNHKGKILEESESVAVNEPSPTEEAILDVAGVSASPEEALQEAEDDDYDNDKDEALDEVEGLATIEMLDPFTGHEDGKSTDVSNQPDVKQSEFHVEFVDAPPRSWVGCTNSEGIKVVCSEDGFQITLPTGRLSGIKVLGYTNISVEDAPEYCGYHLIRNKNILAVHFSGCNVRNVEDVYSLQLSVIVSGQTQVFRAFCVDDRKFASGHFPPTFDKRTKCSKPAVAPPNAVDPRLLRCIHRSTASPATTKNPAAVALGKWFRRTSVPPTTTAVPVKLNYRNGMLWPPKPHNCAVDAGEQISCGHSGISLSDCEKNGCCMDMYKKNCYYPLDECTADRHFVFAIRHDCAVIPVDPRKLVVPGSPRCKPVIVNNEVAIFKIKLGDCGVHSYEVGGMKIYLMEVHTAVDSLNLKYGIISRTDPVRFIIECRYSKHESAVADPSVASVGYMVKTSTSDLPSSIISSGLYEVELKIAKDHTYSSYYPTYHQPLQVLLGHPVHLELNLKSYKPDAVILVNYCLAYPRTAKNALVLIHEGCANPNDPTVSLLKVGDLPTSRHQRRFKVEAFQFMDQKTNKYLDEEIYFMCSAEVCIPSEKPCEERCFDGNVL
ncbi:zona pellucida sperm-binding protein 1 isoform X1 [Kryptolebias marmoratus]|uniref:zona pellucida sperm-binding protein 1 isoform X1 n=1 Tax=Kryptolebias marmoratus TaxID=37003 RepID=UPI000D52F955|nr:zona pellucida sperm-binding protein 1 isoform X1 [Kryptolebias marmoratus]